MQTLSVYLLKDKPSSCDAFRDTIEAIARNVQTGSVTIEWREQHCGKFLVFTFVSWCADEYTLATRDVIRSFVALIVVEWIERVIEPDMVERILRKEYAADADDEWMDILPYVQVVLHEIDEVHDHGSQAASRKAKLYQTIFDYLQENRELYLDGFLRFRLKSHWSELYDAVELGVDEYMQDKEYQEFIQLLHYFVSIQEPKCNLVHVVPYPGRLFRFFDERGGPVDQEQLDAALGLAGQECREEDFLISALITLAPGKIVYHLTESSPLLLETLSGIFGERLNVCTTCAYCLANRRPLDFPKPTHYNT